MINTGTFLNERYEIIEQIGSGGMSIVYKAKCHKLGRFVAIKVLREEFCHDDDFIRRFKVEAQAAASLSHPNIVNVYDVGNDQRVHYIVMEYLQGITLKEYIESYGPLTEGEIIKISLSVSSALEHAHANNIIHRDIKPQNIIISAENQIKVMDFGIARVAGGSTIDLSNKKVAGSVHYISPEQAKGNITDEQSDIYSLGITMYEMATKAVPYQAESAVSIAVLHINQQIPSPAILNSKLSAGLDSIIQKAANNKKENRYLSAKALSNDLKKLAANPDTFSIDPGVAQSAQTIVLSGDDVQVINRQAQKQAVIDKNAGKVIAKEPVKNNKMRIAGIIIGAVGLAAIIVAIGILIAINQINKSMPVTVTVDNYENMSFDEAKTLIEEAGLGYLVKEEIYSEQYDSNTVISQKPKQTSIVEPGTVIELTVSKGEQLYEVPFVEKLQYKKAQTMLVDANLDYQINLQYSESIPVGIVMSQDPASGEMVEAGKTIELIVSNGPEIQMTTVPKVVGKNVEDAKRMISDAKMVLGEVITINDDLVEKDVVISQNVDAGNEVEENYIMNITVSLGKKEMPTKQIAIPNIFYFEQTQGVVKVVLTNQGIETVLFDQSVIETDFPLTFNIQGTGLATLDVYLDGIKDSSQEINFDEGTN